MILLLSLACAIPMAPKVLAERACHAMPGLAVDAAGLAMTQDIVVDSERAIWAAIAPQDRGPGLERIGLNGYGVIRANSMCTLDELSQGHARLTRIEPDISQLPEWEVSEVWDLPTRTRAVEFELVQSAQGLRVQTGLEEARAQADRARAQAQSGDLQGAQSTWRALQRHFPDPMIDFEVLALQEQAQQQALQEQEAQDPEEQQGSSPD